MSEIINKRKKETKKLIDSLLKKLITVQELSIQYVCKGGEISFEISGFSNSAQIRGIGGIDCSHRYHQVRFSHYDFMSYAYSDTVPDHYKKQHEIVDLWIKLLKEKL